MQIRVTRTKRNGQIFEYTQLVESYRRDSEGMPMHRVIANLGSLSLLEVENLKVAIRAGRDHKRVVVVRAAAQPASSASRICANLRYLDAAVLLEAWNHWGLAELLDELIPAGAATIKPSAVLAALTLQRCLDPGSKLYATRWFPKTALPELLGVAADGFNNTRVHRILDDLDGAGSALMAKLPRLYQQQAGAFVSLFLDTSDTWFVGQGPDLAVSGKPKRACSSRTWASSFCATNGAIRFAGRWSPAPPLIAQ